MLEILAASLSPHSGADRLLQIPLKFWLRLGTAILVLIIVVLGVRRLAQGNKPIIAVVAGLVASIVGFSWIYERNEPAWATPTVNFLSGYFPAKAKVEERKVGH
jgi:apolipoprotein N-acyltransferase